MAEAKSQAFIVKMGAINYGWRTSPSAYKGIESILGVEKAKDTDAGIAYGSDNKPPRVRINLADGRSLIRFCAPNKLEDLITKGSLNGKKLNGQNINSVRTLQG